MDNRSRHVIVSVPEQILILRSYKKNGDNWPQGSGRRWFAWESPVLVQRKFIRPNKKNGCQTYVYFKTWIANRKRRAQFSCAIWQRKLTKQTWRYPFKKYYNFFFPDMILVSLGITCFTVLYKSKEQTTINQTMIAKLWKNKNTPFSIILYRGGCAVGLSVRFASGRSGVRIPAATDLSRNNS